METIHSFQAGDTDAIIDLWQCCDLLRPWNDPYKDILRKQSIQPELFLVLKIDQLIVGSVMAGYDGHRGWLNYLAVDPDYREKGYGRRLVEEAAHRLRELGCPKINIQLRKANKQLISFYLSLGFLEDKVLSMGKRLEQDDS